MPIDPPMTCDDLSLTKHSEGLRLVAYPDAQGWSIGYGHFGAKEGDACTEDQASDWLREDISHVESAINTLVNMPLNQNQFQALCDFVFNIGSHAFAESTLLKKLNQGDYTGAAGEFERWVYSGGKVKPGLLARRIQERDLFTKPVEGA